jgi:hypothetical protein
MNMARSAQGLEETHYVKLETWVVTRADFGVLDCIFQTEKHGIAYLRNGDCH